MPLQVSCLWGGGEAEEVAFFLPGQELSERE